MDETGKICNTHGVNGKCTQHFFMKITRKQPVSRLRWIYSHRPTVRTEVTRTECGPVPNGSEQNQLLLI